MHGSKLVALGGLLAAIAVGLGAFGAHGLKTLVEQGRFAAKDFDTFQTAVHYQLIHAVGLVLIGLLANVRPGRVYEAAGWAMFVGIVIFSGSLYAYVASGNKAFAVPVPIGGAAFIAAWLMVAIAAMQK